MEIVGTITATIRVRGCSSPEMIEQNSTYMKRVLADDIIGKRVTRFECGFGTFGIVYMVAKGDSELPAIEREIACILRDATGNLEGKVDFRRDAGVQASPVVRHERPWFGENFKAPE